MTTATFTEKQRQAIEAMEGARGEGVALSEYAKARGLIIRELYDAIACLRSLQLSSRTVRCLWTTTAARTPCTPS
jgi:hypothetical protein